MRIISLFLWLALTSATAVAQLHLFPQPPDESLQYDESAEGRHNQRVENIVLEDSGSRVEERRVAGQTHSITVDPKTTGAPLPSYEVRPNDGARARPGNLDDADSNRAPRVWNLHKF